MLLAFAKHCSLLRPLLTVSILCFLSHPAIGAGWDVTARAAVLMEMETGKILWEKNKQAPRPPASTAKILTALVTLDQVPLKQVVTVSTTTNANKRSAIALKGGERLTIQDLLYALLLQSNNDAALALASHIGGSTPNFVQIMNQKARSLGALHSKFFNPTGMPHRGQVTTASDLTLITKVALANPEFRRIVATKSYPWKSSTWEGTMDNSNQLLKSYTGAIGVKTGSTREVGHFLVAAVQREDKTLIAVVLGSQEKQVWEDAKKLLDHGFETLDALSGKPLSSR